MKLLFTPFVYCFFILISCSPSKEKADLIIHNAVVYTVDSAFSTTQAIAIKDGKILATGTDEEILSKYETKEKLDAEGKSIFPGFIDAHCHFLSYGLGLQRIDLTGTASFDEVIARVKNAPAGKEWIIGRGWDQNDWQVKEYPDKRKLDSLFPDTPVMLTRIDGHAALVNSKALSLAGITEKTKVDGGELLYIPDPLSKNKARAGFREAPVGSVLSGVLIDNAVDLVSRIIPPASEAKIKEALLAAQKNCFAVGLTTVDDAGLMKAEIDLMDKLQKSGELKMRIYAMLSDSAPNYTYYLEKGPYKTDRLNVRSFKFYGDGALGSRGACLLEDYTDKPGWRGFLLNSIAHYTEKADLMEDKGFQMNTHCIGDSAVRLLLQIHAGTPRLYGTPEGGMQEISATRRWRIEHAQVVNPADLLFFKELKVIPSVQPTHATSDMYWAEKRLGKERVKSAYAYRDLLKAVGMLALGTDFPVEDISPFKTFYAAVARKDAKGFPEGGFQMENALTREETIKGMTIWAAYANFEEKEKGSIEKGKFADLIIADKDLMKCPIEEVLSTKVLKTFLNGEKVYQSKL